MVDPSQLYIWVCVWFVAVVAILLRHWRSGMGRGLLLSYVFSLTAIHWISPVGYLLPWSPGGSPTWVASGMRLAALGIVAFAVGAEFVAWRLRESLQRSAADDDDEEPAPVSPLIINLYLAAGLFLHVFVLPIARGIPSVGAVVATGSTLIVVALGLKCWNAWREGDPTRIWFWLAVSTTLPAITIATQGYLGYGMAAMLTVFAFVVSFYGERWKLILVGVLVGYLGMSVYVTYMRDRDYIRNVVWANDSWDRRMDELTYTISRWEWFSPFDSRHLKRIDERLNQNFFVGASIWYINRPGGPPFARGETLVEALQAIVPRMFWPDKPTTAGSGDLVADYTGFFFYSNTSVGVGHIMEFYINFGVPGVVIGFLIMGGLLVLIDQRAAAALNRGDPTMFIVWYLPGLALLQVGGSFVDATSTAAAALAVAGGLNIFIKYSPPTAPAQQPEPDTLEPSRSEVAG